MGPVIIKDQKIKSNLNNEPFLDYETFIQIWVFRATEG